MVSYKLAFTHGGNPQAREAADQILKNLLGEVPAAKPTTVTRTLPGAITADFWQDADSWSLELTSP